jgi:RNA polymerase sigma-70 factor, ECF subfamily
MGSAAGLRELIDAHYEALYRYAYRLTGSAADAEDLTQEAFGKALARLAQLREPERAKAWLFRILRNLYLHKVRDEKRHRVVPLDAVGDLPGRPIDAEPLIEPGRLQQALDELDEGFRTPLILFYFEEFSYRDIAEQMELPIGTVMSRLARAKAYLRAKLCPNGAEEFAALDGLEEKPSAMDSPDRAMRGGSRVT